jgi:hypothetical protein
MASDAGRERAEGSVPDRDDRPALPYARAFVVQFGAETDGQLGNFSGRIEHLQTGRRSRFASVDDLLAFIMAMLAGVDASHQG